MALFRFADRADAGRRLGERLAYLRGEDIVVLGLAGGGVPVAFEVARRLGSPLDIVLVRRLRLPADPAVTLGAVGEGGAEVIDESRLHRAGIAAGDIASALASGRAELARLDRVLRGGHPPVPLADRTVLLVDDGILTGATARAACRSARLRGSDRVLLAAPVATPGAVIDLSRDAEVVCLEVVPESRLLGDCYRDFAPTDEDDVARLIRTAGASRARQAR